MSKRPQLLKLIAEHPEAHQDPSLLHPLFARLPPLYPDTPDAPAPPPPGTLSARPSTRPSRGSSRPASRASASRSRSRSRRRGEKPPGTDEKPSAGAGEEADEKAAIREQLERSATLAPEDAGDEKAALKAELDGPILAELEPRAEALITDTLSASGGELLESVEVELGTPPLRDEDANPFAPLVLSDVFRLADSLMEKYPWDGALQGLDVLGPGSVVRTFDWERRGRPVDAEDAEAGDESADGEAGESSEDTDTESDSDSEGVRTPRAKRTPFTHADAEACIDADVIMPGGDELDELDEDAPPPVVKRVPRHFLSQILPGKLAYRVSNFGTALALGILVVGIGAVVLGWRRNSAWALWWGHVAQGWLRRSQLSRFLALLG